MEKLHQRLTNISHTSRTQKKNNSVVTANVIEVEFPYDKANSSHDGSIKYDENDAFDASFITFTEESKARKIFQSSSRLELPGLLSPFLLVRCEFRLSETLWTLCYDRFELTLDSWKKPHVTMKSVSDALHPWWCTAIRDALITIKQIHDNNYTHTGLGDECNYIIHSNCLKIVNVEGEEESHDDTAFIDKKVQDLKDFSNFLRPKFEHSSADTRDFFEYFDNVAAGNYDEVIKKLITHPLLMGMKQRLKYFRDIGKAIKEGEVTDDLLEELADPSPVFAQHLNWVSKLKSKSVNLKRIFETPNATENAAEANKKQKIDFNGDDVTDLIRFLKNVYTHRVRSGSFQQIDSEIRGLYEGFLCHLHKRYDCKNTKECVCALCSMLAIR